MVYLVIFEPNCEERNIMYISMSYSKCEDYIKNFKQKIYAFDMEIYSLELDKDLDYV